MRVELEFNGECIGSQFDNVSVYQGTPTIDFPYAYQDQTLADWTSTNGSDAMKKVCGQGTYDLTLCGFRGTFP